MAERYLGLHLRMLPVPVGSNPAGERITPPSKARSEVEYYLGLSPKEEQSFQGLIDHLSLAFQLCRMVSSLIADFYNHSKKIWETEGAFTDQLQVLVRKIVAQKHEFIGEANQALKHQYAQNLRDPYLEWWPEDSVCLPLTLKALHNFGVGWPSCLIAGGNNAQRQI